MHRVDGFFNNTPKEVLLSVSPGGYLPSLQMDAGELEALGALGALAEAARLVTAKREPCASVTGIHGLASAMRSLNQPRSSSWP